VTQCLPQSVPRLNKSNRALVPLSTGNSPSRVPIAGLVLPAESPKAHGRDTRGWGGIRPGKQPWWCENQPKDAASRSLANCTGAPEPVTCARQGDHRKKWIRKSSPNCKPPPPTADQSYRSRSAARRVGWARGRRCVRRAHQEPIAPVKTRGIKTGVTKATRGSHDARCKGIRVCTGIDTPLAKDMLT